MTAPKAVEPCPECGSVVVITPTHGGQGTGRGTKYAAECQCGLRVPNLSKTGKMRGAVSDWNQVARELKRKASMADQPTKLPERVTRARTTDAAPRVSLTRADRPVTSYVRGKPSKDVPREVPGARGTPDATAAPSSPFGEGGGRVHVAARDAGTHTHVHEGGIDAVLAAFKLLKPAERKQALALMSLELQKTGGDQQRDQELWSLAVHEALEAALGPADGGGHGPQVIRRLVSLPANWNPVEEFMRSAGLDELKPAERLAAYHLLARLVVQRAKGQARYAGIPLNPKLVVNCSHSVAGLFDNAFPGYVSNGFAKLVIRASITGPQKND